LDCSKAQTELGWRPVLGLSRALAMTASWYRETASGSAAEITDRQIAEYEQLLINQKELCARVPHSALAGGTSGMRIAFNGQRLAGQPFGVGRYLEYLLRYWDKQLVEREEVSLFVRQPLGDRLSELGPRIRTVLLESRLPGLPWETLRLGPAAANHDVL